MQTHKLTSPLTLRADQAGNILHGSTEIGKFTLGKSKKDPTKDVVSELVIHDVALRLAFGESYLAALMEGSVNYAISRANNNAKNPVDKLLGIIGSGFGLLDAPSSATTKARLVEIKGAMANLSKDGKRNSPEFFALFEEMMTLEGIDL